MSRNYQSNNQKQVFEFEYEENVLVCDLNREVLNFCLGLKPDCKDEVKELGRPDILMLKLIPVKKYKKVNQSTNKLGKWKTKFCLHCEFMICQLCLFLFVLSSIFFFLFFNLSFSFYSLIFHFLFVLSSFIFFFLLFHSFHWSS